MNAITLVATTLLVFTIAYRLYGKFIITKILVFDGSKPTPAHLSKDGRDYHPTNKYVLFGHHFAAIAGAGPLVGPVLAAQFGYLPGFLWILIGTVLGGAVHDLVILFASVRMNGQSISNIAKNTISVTAGIATGIAVLFIIITALAGLALVVVNALSESAWATFTIAVTVPAALVVGLYMYKIRPNHIIEASVIGVLIVLSGVIFGRHVSESPFSHYFIFSRPTLSIVLPIYGFVASVLPVWLLLCPRDYLSSYMKIGTIGLLAIGIFLVNPTINMPALTPYIHGNGPIIPGAVWPFVCITVACGAISGFHALVSSGTTPKMINNESDILMIGYGSMLMESIVSVLALIAATVMTPGDYFAINLPPDVFSELGFSITNLHQIEGLVNETLTNRAGGAVTLATGMAVILSGIPGMNTLMSYWYHFAIMFEALFILTTVDTGTRVARYILQEMLSKLYKPLGDGKNVISVMFSGAVISFCWGYLVYNGDISTIWPMFGVANQLLATIALAIGTVYLLKNTTKWHYCLITFLPSIFMLVTTITAGILNIFTNYLPKHTFQGNFNAALSLIMIVLVALVYIESLKIMHEIWLRRNSK